MTSPRELIRQLELAGEQMGDLQRRLLDSLKDYADASEAYLGSIERHIERATLGTSCIVAEAAWILHEQDAVRMPGGAQITRRAAVAAGYRERAQ